MNTENENLSKNELALVQEVADLRSLSFFHGSLFGCFIGIVAGIILGCVWATDADAAPKVYKLDLSYGKIIHNADPMMYEVGHNDWTTNVRLQAGIESGRWFLEPHFHFESAYSKVMSVGLFFKTGLRITDNVDVSWIHHSRHIADRSSKSTYVTDDTNYTTDVSRRKYPLWDSVEATWHIVPDKRSRK